MTPLISVITINFNNKSGLIRTSDSVLKQTFRNQIEWIVVDGGSTDGSVDYLESISSSIGILISEKDEGIYDAMNKGFALSAGEYLLFLNSGDTFHASDVVALTIGFINEYTKIHGKKPEAMYGDTQFVSPQGDSIGLISQLKPQPFPKVLTAKSFRFGMNICHQSLFLHRSVFVPFNDKKYRLAADVDSIIASLKRLTVPGLNLGFVVSDFEVGGSSYQHTKKAWKERFTILSEHYGWLPNLFNHGWIFLRRALFSLNLYKP
ncbi:MAG: glycosyltransferase family 2 protein [Flavobacterium stagni]